jgi:hypothetical protein
MRLRYNRFITFSMILMAAWTIAGCGASLFTYNGSRVTQKNFMVLLKDGDQQGVWKTNELAVTYQYEMTPGAMKISGSTELLGGFAIGFSWIKSLAVYVLFLDNQGVVMENALIYSTRYRRSSDALPMEFEASLPIPAGVQTISFAYEGELMGSGVMDQTTYSIWFSPSRH